MKLEEIESFLGNRIEGFFNKRFASDLEPVELADGVRKEIRHIAADNHGKVPNLITFTLNPGDYSRLCAKRVHSELCVAIEKEIIKGDAFMEGELTLKLHPSDEMQKGLFDLQLKQETSGDEKESTIVVSDASLTEQASVVPVTHKLVSLSVLEGPDAEAYLEFGEQKIYIGRRDKNEFILTDGNASRLHAWVAYEQHRHVLYDAHSTNGTFVNDKPIERVRLSHGDRVRIGATLLKYEVI